VAGSAAKARAKRARTARRKQTPACHWGRFHKATHDFFQRIRGAKATSDFFGTPAAIGVK